MTASLGIFAIHTVEIWFYALLYVALGAIEGATGIIMLGLSTALLVSLLTQLRLLSHDWLSPSLPALTGDETP